MRKKAIILVLSCVSMVLFAGIFCTFPAKAAGDYGQQAIRADLYKCYYQSKLKTQVNVNNVLSPESVIQDFDNFLALPNTKYPDGAGGLFSCADLLNNYVGGLSFDMNNITSVGNFLTKLGYKGDGGSGSEKCWRINYLGQAVRMGAGEDGTAHSYHTSQICASVDSNGRVTSSGYNIKPSPENTQFPLILSADGVISANSLVDDLQVDGFVPGSNFDDMVRLFYNRIPIELDFTSVNGYLYSKKSYEFTSSPSSGTAAIYRMSNVAQAYQDAARNIFGDNSSAYDNTHFSEDQQKALVSDYLKQYFEISCEWSVDATEIATGNTDEEGNTIYVYVKAKSNAPSTFYIPKGDSTWFDAVDMNGFLEYALNTSTDLQCSKNPDPGPPGSSGGSTTTIDMKACYNGTGVLGWILCPVIDILHTTTNAIYDSIITPFLEINVDIFDNSNGVYAGWQVFQGFANVAFVILLLIVIFSQITGVGIDNLGIKRILPKLIVAAVLINLSYIICQLLVDISNIAGVSLRNVFEAIQITGSANSTTGGTWLATSLAATVGAMTATALGGTAAMWAPMLILPLLLGLVGILISVLFMFILLGIRQAGVIILVVVAPVAFVTYMLPNTKKIFDRWFKAFSGLLLLFPICGALIGGSELAGKILHSSSNEFWVNLIASLLTVVPFFFVPTLLRGSFSALGNLGAKISGFGSRVSGTIQGAAKQGIGDSAWYKNVMGSRKDRMDFRDANREQQRAERIVKRLRARQARSSLSERDKNTLARYQQRVLSYQKEQEDIRRLSDASYAKNASAQIEADAFNKQVEAVKAKNSLDGITNVTGDVKDFDGSGSSFAKGSLAYALYNAQNDEERYAATSQLMASGHHGAEALHQVMEALGRDNNTAALESVAKAAKSDSKLGDLKSGARSTYDYVNDVASGMYRDNNGNLVDQVASGKNINDYAGKVKFGGMSEQQLINADKEELSRYSQVINQKRINGQALSAEERKLVQQASAAWNNERLRGSAKKDVQNLMQEIAFGHVGVGNSSARPGENFDVRSGRSGSNAGNGSVNPDDGQIV